MSQAATKSKLELAFLEDHRHLLKGLRAMGNALEAGDVERARSEAREVDRLVGPHMRFEEEEFYPTLREVLGDDYVDRLYDEHSEGQNAVRLLVGSEEPLDAAERERLKGQIQTTLDHAVSCGTLLSHLDALDDSRQEKLLDRLLELRERQQLWSEFTSGA